MRNKNDRTQHHTRLVVVGTGFPLFLFSSTVSTTLRVESTGEKDFLDCWVARCNCTSQRLLPDYLAWKDF
jgi:hypothetical protein